MDKQLTAREIRELCREGKYFSPTIGNLLKYVQANIISLPKYYAFDFLLFCQRNQKSCSLLEVLEAGECSLENAAKVNIKTDLPRYLIFKKGQQEECLNIKDVWQTDLVTFIFDSSVNFDYSLIKAGIPVRHINQKRNMPLYETNIDCCSAGGFSSKMVVSMRPVKYQDLMKTIEITRQFPSAHGEPIHIGDPEAIGIKDLFAPDYGQAVAIHHREVPVFWASAATAKKAVAESQIDFFITNAPGHMLVTDQEVA